VVLSRKLQLLLVREKPLVPPTPPRSEEEGRQQGQQARACAERSNPPTVLHFQVLYPTGHSGGTPGLRV
tara:strand:+ start:13712 stop:13918 length:207 start_codon:yes stop_codon:yes gene_type:complete